MAAYYFDASALVKRYVPEIGSSWVGSIVDPNSGHDVYIARITLVEVIAAVARRRNTGSISTPDAMSGIQQFQADFVSEYETIELTNSTFDDAATFADTHALRAYDAVQLAVVVDLQNQRAANALPPVTLISSDLDLNAVANALGIPVDDPNNHP